LLQTLRIKIFLFFLTFLLGVSLSSLGLAQGSPEKKGWQFRGGRGMMMNRMHSPMMDWASRLNLTEEQTARLQQLRDSYLQDTMEWRNELLIKRFDLRDLMNNPKADTNAILGKQREISELESKIQERALLFQIEMRKVLTPEQIQLLPPPGGGGMYGPSMMPGRGRGMGREY
jgi:Spy/CpxP family protein refolding chaperone